MAARTIREFSFDLELCILQLKLFIVKTGLYAIKENFTNY